MTDQIAFMKGRVGEAVALMRDTARWLDGAGRHLWALDELTWEQMRGKYGAQPDQVITCEIGGVTAAAMILLWHDPLVWPEIPPGESGFVHKLCVSRRYAGMGLPGKLMEYAGEECRKRGVRWLRLDTDSTRPKLCNLYDGLGFTDVGRKTVGRFHVALYEMSVTL